MGCTNNGNISCSGTPDTATGSVSIAGIAGLQNRFGRVESTLNTGNVTGHLVDVDGTIAQGRLFCGGITNQSASHAAITANNCLNTGSITGDYPSDRGSCVVLCGGIMGCFGAKKTTRQIATILTPVHQMVLTIIKTKPLRLFRTQQVGFLQKRQTS